jgi:23S rRNA (guanine2445-N2)-methyltransferase / 23S rRNA (guanine2069-N7)-methyltransferase
MNKSLWFASCPRGLENLLFQELPALGAEAVRETIAGVYFEGELSVAYRTALWSRLANRVLLQIAEIPVTDSDSMLRGLQQLPWPEYLPEACSFVVDFTGQNNDIRNTQYGAQVAKDAIVDHFREHGLKRPEVARRDAEVRFRLRLGKGKLNVALDFVGGSLHQRGYRLDAGGAPLKENLAAALLVRADWPTLAEAGGALIDPMCGSGTLLLEGAMMAADMAPGLWRKHWSFENQSWHHPDQWQAIRKDAEARAERGLAAELPEIRGYDADAKVIAKAEANIERAGLEGRVRVSCKSLEHLKKPTHKPIEQGLVICNPPYGERMGDREQLPALYRELGDAMLREFPGWRAAVLTADKELGWATGLRSSKQYSLYNGALPSTLLLFELNEENRRQPRSDGTTGPVLSEGAQMFANRLRKNLQQADRWARKQGVSCYRVYDADMPEYAVAIDRYGPALHVAEYKAPAGVEPDAAERRLREVAQALPGVTGIDSADIHYKQRQRQRGKDQYQKTGVAGRMLEVQEGRVKLLVNLADYLDTGLFLDHRPLRLRIAAEAAGKDFLNLYCYTASATVHAAINGANSTCSVDLSNTYLDWAGQNLAANGLAAGEVHSLVRADTLQWLQEDTAKYDLILLDPPSFSNSKSMQGSFDVQRDHVELVKLTLARLREGGVLYFSNNLRSFKIDPALAEIASVEDISASTIDFDFRRKPKIHRCWRLTLN